MVENGRFSKLKLTVTRKWAILNEIDQMAIPFMVFLWSIFGSDRQNDAKGHLSADAMVH